MQIVVDSNRPDTDELRERVPARLQFALRRFRPAVQSARVRLTDVNGPRQGADKQCLVQLRLQSRGTVVAVTRADDWVQAFNRAVASAIRLMLRQLRKVRR